jgi:hypothetical protein
VTAAGFVRSRIGLLPGGPLSRRTVVKLASNQPRPPVAALLGAVARECYLTLVLRGFGTCPTMSCSCAAIHQCPWSVNIECPIECPYDHLPRQGVNFRARNWHSLTLTANFEFNQKGWSIGDSNPGPLACQQSGPRFSGCARGRLHLKGSSGFPSRAPHCHAFSPARWSIRWSRPDL